MNNCDNELIIFDYIENELSKEDKIEFAEHLQHCSYCQKLYNEYSAIKKKTNIFYSSIDFNQTPVKHYQIKRASQIFKKVSIAFSIAASFVLGFLLLSNNYDNNLDFPTNTDSIYQTVSEPLTILNQSEWSLELNLIKHKIELIQDQMKQ